MQVSLVNALAKHLKLPDADAEVAIQRVASEIRRALDDSDRVEVPAIGAFFRSDSGISFEPDPVLLQAANLETDGLRAVTLPGRAQTAPAAPAAPSVDDDSELPDDFADTGDGADDAGLLEANVEAELHHPREPAMEAPEVPHEKPDPVANWSEDDFEEDEDEDVDEEDDELEDFEEEDESVWHGGTESMSPLGVRPVDDDYQDADFSVIGGEEDLGGDAAAPAASESSDEAEPTEADAAAATAAAASSAAQAAAHREDRPPERHAQPHEVHEEKPARRKRSLFPIMLVGAILIAGLAAAVYFMLLRGPEREPIVEREVVETPAAETQAPAAGLAGGLVDSAVVPETGAPAETVEEASDPATAGSQDVAAAEPTIDVAAGGWTVIVGSATSTEEATEIVERFRSLGHAAVVLYGPYGGVSRYRIAVSQFPNEAAAIAYIRDSPEGLPGDAWRLPITSDLEIIETQD